MKGVFVILDGGADEGCSVLGGKTPLEAAKTPHLDALAKYGTVDHCYTVKEGVAPESSGAIISLLGYDPNLFARGSFETLGAGVKFTHGDLVWRTNFATIDDLNSCTLLDRRAGRTLSTKEARILAAAVNEKVKLPYPFTFQATAHHRGVLVFRGGFSDNLSNVDPHYSSGSVGTSSNQVKFSEPLDEDSDSRLSADLINSFVRQSHEVLDTHPLNLSRAKKGLYSANFILCRDPGMELPRFPKLKGKWMALAYMPLEMGIARAAKMEVYTFTYPALRGIDVYDNFYRGLKKAIKKAVKMIKRNHSTIDYFWVHFKETDLPGHDNKPLEKVKMFELLDKRFFSFLQRFVDKHPARVVVTADHTTSCRQKAHTSQPVPVLFYPGNKNKERDQRFTEEQGLKGKKHLGRKLLEKTLFS